MNMNSFNCLICGNIAFETVKSNNYNYYKCASCKTSQILPQPSSDILAAYYDRYHFPDDQGGNYDWIEERMKADFNAKINIIKSYTNSDNIQLLDVGCGKGFFVKAADSAGFTSMGIDISNSGISYAKDVLNVNAILTSIEELSNQEIYKEKFDVVTLWATIEHIPNPQILLKSINKCLKKNGLLFLDTGLGDSKLEKLLTGHSQWYDALQHLFVFSEKGLKILLENSEFGILKIDRNFERSRLRKVIRFIRHFYFSFISFLLLRPILGRAGFNAMQKESKWPIGKLIHIVAKKR